MANLIRMDLYRMARAKRFWICLALAFLFAASVTPLSELIIKLAGLFGEAEVQKETSVSFISLLSNPFPAINAMLVMLSACGFFYADVENGYVKNIAGQMPDKGFTILSKFIAILPHNLLFMLAGVAGSLLGSVFFRRITMQGDVLEALRVIALKLLLMQSLCCLLLLATTALQSKSLGTVLAVLMGLGMMSLIYLAIDSGLNAMLPKKNFAIGDYMPDTLLGEEAPKTLRAILSALITGGIFLPLTIRIFDKKDVK